LLYFIEIVVLRVCVLLLVFDLVYSLYVAELVLKLAPFRRFILIFITSSWSLYEG